MECPATHSCNNGVCCPTKREDTIFIWWCTVINLPTLFTFHVSEAVCKLPKMVGFCNSNFVKRWYFNAGAGTCEEFTYSGCHGNANNFDSYKECTSYCRNVKGGLEFVWIKFFILHNLCFVIFLAEPKCAHGRALKDSHSNFIYCGAVSEQLQTQSCPVNFQCYYDGKTYGCCPTQSKLLLC